MRGGLFKALSGVVFLFLWGCDFPQEGSVPIGPPTGATICSKLDFSQVHWPSRLSEFDKPAFQVALNISGSFEGNDGWVNLTGDFDGEGLSLGLLNQNLGSGSLQPLQIAMRDRYMNKMKGLMDPSRLQNLLSMLSRWESGEQPLELPSGRLSLLDTAISKTGVHSLNVRNDDSVNWALENLYESQNFKPGWAKDLTALAQSAEYISIQVDSALDLHFEAMANMKRLGLIQWRAYLMMFDVSVQNGGIYETDFADYADFLKSQPQATETQKLEEILNLRLRHVRPEYVSDVRRRKQSIIEGHGLVHGEDRDLEREYCYDGHASTH